MIAWVYKRERETKRKRGKRDGRGERNIIFLFNIVVYIILLSCR